MSTPQELRARLSTVQDRFERSPAGQAVISALVVLILTIAVVWSAPDSALRRSGVRALEPVALTAGVDQAWYMFSPDPIRRLETVDILFETAGGRQRVWRFPTGNAVDQFTWYRWHKLKETAVRTPDIRAGITRWAARGLLAPSDYPAQATMLLHAEGFPSPSGDVETPADVDEVLYTETLEGPP